MNESRSSAPARRPNGRPAACGPCRARKVACDHTYPTCSRCRSRNTPTLCVYRATAPRIDASRGHCRTRSSGGGLRGAEPFSRPARSPFAQATPPQSEQQSPGSARPNRNKTPSNVGYLGAISHTAVLEETKNRLSLLRGPDSPDIDELLVEARRRRQGLRFCDLPRPEREACLFVLRCLPGQCDERMVFLDPVSESEGWTHIAVDRIVDSLQGEFAELLNGGDRGLELLAEIICDNTAQPFRDEYSNPQQWLDQFCGSSLRWESLGLLWAHLEHISDVVDALRSRRLGWTNGIQSTETSRACLSYCIELSRQFTDGNALLLDLCRRRSTLDSMIDGDASMSEWASHGVTVAMMTFLGLHAHEADEPYQPTMCSENKRRLVAQIFKSDTSGVLFTGRPPLISRRYCSTPLPLDIRDEDLVSDEATLARAVSALDGRGWNTDSGVYPSTIIRARCMIAYVRDDLVEVSLSSRAYVTIDQLLGIKARQISTVSEFPESLRYHPDDLNNTQINTQTLYIRLVLQLEHLQNIFLVERLLLRHGYPDSGDLIVTGFTMVSSVLTFWAHKDRFAEVTIRRNFNWLVIAYGASGGGLLCQELLRPTFSGIHHKDPKVTRSSIVQQLSLLVGFLDWVRPSAANAELCADCSSCIQAVLDHYLNAASNNEVVDQFLGSQHQPDFNFELLDTFDWIRTDMDQTGI